jgi:chorismate mutase
MIAAAPEGALDAARREIERVDAALVALVAERVRWSEAVGAAKRRLGRPTLDPAREPRWYAAPESSRARTG